MRTANERFLYVIVGALVSYALLETTVIYVREQRASFRTWLDAFVAPFARTPGRREWLRETLMREEMTVKQTVPTDCGCDDGA